MKRCKMFDVRWMMFLLLVVFSMFNVQSSMVFAQNDAMYIYRNDGVINAFLKADIDSIRHSALDLDSVMHAENVTQEVWTVDSIYRIPLAAIDSVSFITPPTKYKEDVKRLEYNLLDYIIGADGRTLKLKFNTPTMILPVKGDKLVLLEGCNVLPNGFSGIVSHVEPGSSSIDVVCEQVYLEDLFDSFCSVLTAYGGNPDDGPEAVRFVSGSGRQRVVYNPNDIIIPLGTFKASCSGEISQGIVPGGDLALSGGAGFSVEIQPRFRIHTFLRYGPDEPETYFQCSITGDLSIKSESSLYGGLSFNHDFDKVVYDYPIPQTADLVKFYINPGVFVRANATITSKMSTTHVYTFGMAFDYSSRGWNTVKSSVGGRLASQSVDLEGCLDGSLAGGGYIEAGFSLLCREIARVCVRGEMGYQFNSNFMLRNSDIDKAGSETTLYERLKASSFEMGPFVNIGLYSSVGTTEASAKWEMSHTDLKCDYVPTFSNTKLTRTSSSKTSVNAYTELRGNCVLPVPVGYKLFDGNKKEVKDDDANVSYNNRESQFEYIFTGLKEGEKYIVYPKVKLFGHDILASPEAELDIPVNLSDFKVTKKQYKKGAFIHEGKPYDYRFDVTVTATFEGNTEDIADWGYVYRDPNGKEAFISLYEFGHSKEDDRWAYFRSGTPPFTCTLYGYVKYVGNDEPVCGKLHGYSLLYDITVDTGSAAASYTEARCWGNASDSNNTIYDECGFFYNMTGSPQKGNASRQFCSMNADGSFNAILSGLTEDTQYFYTAYVRMGEDYYYGEPKTFKTNKKEAPEDGICPDGHHPHNIDLGLPSGTKWKCCNYGSNSPIDVGFYLAWGETSEKNTYTKENYNWHHVKGDGTYVYENATFDLAPSKSDVSELQRVCSQEETVLGGVIGMMYIGPNGNRIFLPYGGVKGETLYFYGEEDHYWTNKLDSRSNNINIQPSTRSDNDKDEGISNAFDWYDLDWRYLGKNVRQVIH